MRLSHNETVESGSSRISAISAASSQPPQAPRSPAPLLRQPTRGCAAAATSDRAARDRLAEALQPLGRRASLQPAASAAAAASNTLRARAADEQPAARTGPMISVELHPVPPWDWWLLTPPASKEARMNNVLRNYTWTTGVVRDCPRLCPSTQARRAPLTEAVRGELVLLQHKLSPRRLPWRFEGSLCCFNTSSRSYTRRVDTNALAVLEFPAIAERLGAATATTRGTELAQSLRPQPTRTRSRGGRR